MNDESGFYSFKKNHLSYLIIHCSLLIINYLDLPFDWGLRVKPAMTLACFACNDAKSKRNMSLRTKRSNPEIKNITGYLFFVS
jgi:hypothetical protein